MGDNGACSAGSVIRDQLATAAPLSSVSVHEVSDERYSKLTEEIDKLAAILVNVPTVAQIKRLAENFTSRHKRRSYIEPRHKIVARLANSDIDGMTFDWPRELMQMEARRRTASAFESTSHWTA
jgi:hypothetical protein